MNNTASAVVGFTAVAAATVGVWFAQRWRQGKSAQAEWAAKVALSNALRKGPGDVVHLRYSWLNALNSLQLNGWDDLTHLNVSYNQLSSLSLLPNTPLSHLTYLDVSGNKKLRSLESIQILSTSLVHFMAGRCEISDISALDNFNQLEHLDLNNNLILAFDIRLPSLKSLNLRGNLIQTLPASFCDSTELIDLNLHGLQLKHLPEGFSRLVNLENLCLRANKLNNIAGVEHLVNLVFLDLTKPGNGISFGLCDLSGMKSVTELRLSGMRLTEIPESLLDLKALFYLDLVQNAITRVPSDDDLLTHGVPWRRVNLAFNSLTEFPVALLALPGLEHLCVRNNVFELSPQVEILDPSEAIKFWKNQFNISNSSSSRRTSASSETLAALVSSSFLSSGDAPSVEQADAQESIWFDLFAYRSEEKPALLIPQDVLGELGKELILDRLVGALYGSACGDAIGLATEFMPKDMANFYYDTERGFDTHKFVPDAHRSHFEPGDWTDDTDQGILILDNIVQHKGQFNTVDYAQAILRWVNHGFSELNDSAGCGCGQHTYNVMSHAQFKSKPVAAALDVWEKSQRMSAPNGAVMRTTVVGCNQFWNPTRVIADAVSAAQVTHADPRCVASAVAVSMAVANLLSSDPSGTFVDRVASALEAAERAARPYIDTCPADQQQEYERYMNAASLKELHLGENKAMGYTFKALGAGFWALREARTESFENIISMITLEGGDADSNAVVAGALVGALVGFRALPAKWISQLRHTEWLNNKIKSLLDLYGITLQN